MADPVAPSELAELVPYVGYLLQWLRKEDSYAGDLFIGDALFVEFEDLQAALQLMLEEHRKEGHIGSDEMKSILDQHKPPLWARVVYVIFSNAIPHVVNDDCANDLRDAFGGANPDKWKTMTRKEIKDKVWPVIKGMDEDRQSALFELCLTIKDTALDPESTAVTMGPNVLAHGDLDDVTKKWAQAVMNNLVENVVFAWNKESLDKKKEPGPRYAQATSSPQAVKNHRQQLKAFFDWRGEKGAVAIVDDLFKNFEFVDIARGVYNKYGLVPEEWGEELAAIKKEGSPGMEWFEPHRAQKPKRLSLAPVIDRRPIRRPFGYKATQVDKIIDEVIATEVTYHDAMKDLFDMYIEEITAIADGKQGQDAMDALGISSAEIQNVFGDRLVNVLDVSNNLLGKLDLVALVPMAPFDPIGRPGLLAKIFNEHAQSLRVYAPYISSHMEAMRTLKAGVAKVEKNDKRKSGRARKLLGTEKKHKPNFVSIWFEHSNFSKHLKGHTLESILIQPVQRVPRYRLLLETLLKEVPKLDKNHPSLSLIRQASESVNAAAAQINTAVKQHMKLQSFFGEDQMISPNSSIARKDGEGNFLAIVNSYVG